MNIQSFFIQVAIIAFGGGLSVVAAYFLIKGDIQNYFRFKLLATNKENRSALFPLRLQAHERLIVFVERINPSNLLVRLHQQGISVRALQDLVLTEIKNEYQHNITQQLYVDNATWQMVKKLKDDTITLINNVARSFPENAEGIDLSRKILQHMSEIEANPYELTIEFVKKNIQSLF
jgi:hypothetical protein